MKSRRVRDLLKQGAVAATSIGNVYPVLATPRTEVEGLMRLLHPRLADQELVRLGPAGDGGYLVPDDLEGVEACFSPGVGTVFGFEQACAARGMRVFMADASVDAPVVGDERFSFEKKYVGAVNSDDRTTLDAWVERSLPGSSGDLLLQIDIEGAEYETFLSVSEALLGRFRIITGEFHFLDHLWNKRYFDLVARGFEKVLRGHYCVHIHPNNHMGSITRKGLSIPPVMEFTFVRKDRLSGQRYASRFPHPADAPNAPGENHALPRCWYRGN